MSERVPVLIVGAGPVGLALAGDLGWRGVPCMLIEKTDGEIEQPKMDLIGVRTMEFCRRWGIADWVRDAPYPGDYPQDYVWLTRSPATSSGASRSRAAPSRPARRKARRSASACRRTCSIRSSSASRPRSTHVNLQNNTELVSFEEMPDRVRATVRDARAATTRTIEADYLIGTDGGASTVRETLGIR